ncbi:MAG: hypothetical protein ABII27_04250, partial [bacterium]
FILVYNALQYGEFTIAIQAASTKAYRNQRLQHGNKLPCDTFPPEAYEGPGSGLAIKHFLFLLLQIPASSCVMNMERSFIN